MFSFFKRPKPRHHFEYICAECGEIHKGPPSFSFERPVGYAEAKAGEDDAKLIMDTPDFCVMGYGEDRIDYFIRVTLEVPINGTDDVFHWGVWVTQSKESFERYHNTFGQDQSEDGSFGWLFANFSPYNDLAHLPCDVVWQTQGTRPKVTLQEKEHPLVHDQHSGISMDRAIEIATLYRHGQA